MAIPLEHCFFVGENVTLRLPFADLDADAQRVGTTSQNMANWTIAWAIAAHDDTPPLLTKTATVQGAYDQNPAANTQVAVVTLTPAETRLLGPIPDGELGAVASRTLRHSWARRNAGSKTILAYGKVVVSEVTQH